MKLNLQHKRAKKKPKSSKQALARSIFAVVPVRKLIKNKRAVSAVISNMILIAAVIVVGFVALGYARSTSNNYVAEYGQTVNSDIAKLKETIAFEYAFYNATRYGSANGSLTVFLMNAGSINDITIKNSAVSNSSWSTTFNCTGQTKFLNSTLTSAFDIGEEGYYIQPLNTTLVSGTVYTVKILTGRGSTFVYNFAA